MFADERHGRVPTVRSGFVSNMVVCPEPRAAKVGRDVFARGGNAADAAIAAAFAQGVTNPLLCGLGGTGTIYYYDGQTHHGTVLCFEVTVGSRPAPAAWADELLGRSETVGAYVLRSKANQVGYQSIMTPGFVRGCWATYQRFASGRLSWAELLAPSVRLAKEGFEVYPYIAGFWRDVEPQPGHPTMEDKFNATACARRTYLKPDGTAYEEGDLFLQPELAATIQRLADAGGDDFYTGEIAGVVGDDLSRHGALVTEEDLRGFAVDEDPPLRGGYRGLEITSTPLNGGAHIIEMLHILEHLDLAALGHNTPEYIDLFARVQRAVFADLVRLKGLSRQEKAPLEQEMIGPERAASWAQRIKSGERIIVRNRVAGAGTTHLTCIDSDQNVVLFNHSIGGAGGSGVVTPGLGFLYNNMLGHYNPVPGRSDSIVPGKRKGGGPPALILKNGAPYIALGAPGGSRIITSIVQTIVNVVDHGMDMRTAVSVPRFHSEEQQLIALEPAFAESTAEALRTMGNTIKRSTYQARVQAALVRPDSGELEPGPDPRGGAGVGRYP